MPRLRAARNRVLRRSGLSEGAAEFCHYAWTLAAAVRMDRGLLGYISLDWEEKER